jgi:carbonic anhydrase
MPADAVNKRLYYDGDRVYMDINLGEITYFNNKGAKEVYQCERLEFHFPAEHFITMHGETPRYALELQIYHKLKSTDNMQITNEILKVNKAAISLLFTVGELEEGDIFLNQLGISKYNTDDEDKFLITKRNNFINRKKTIPATFGVGFNYLAFQGLVNLLNADRHMYFYYGSETTPPCREEILWMVFAEPRSMSKPQFDFLLLMLAKNKHEGKTLTDASTPDNLFGNNRRIILYDEIFRGKILSNHIGLKYVHKKSFFRKLNDSS